VREPTFHREQPARQELLEAIHVLSREAGEPDAHAPGDDLDRGGCLSNMFRDVGAGPDRDQHDAQVIRSYDRASRMTMAVVVLGLAAHLPGNLREIMESIEPHGVGVVTEARHLCMMMRGVEKQNSMLTTSSVLGTFRTSHATRAELLALLDRPRP
jgi:hypothetical protein